MSKYFEPEDFNRIPLSPHRTRFRTHNRKEGLLVSNRKKVCILGAADRTYPLQPLEEDAWELWSCNSLWHLGIDNNKRFRADRWFELHPYWAQTGRDIAFLKACPIPVYTLTLCDDWAPTSVQFPIEQVLGMGYRKAFCSTFAYQVALAIYHKFTHIRLRGVNMVAGREALIERPNLLYWLGVAEGRGIHIDIDDPLVMQAPHAYGYQYTQEGYWGQDVCRAVIPTLQLEVGKHIVTGGPEDEASPYQISDHYLH